MAGANQRHQENGKTALRKLSPATVSTITGSHQRRLLCQDIKDVNGRFAMQLTHLRNTSNGVRNKKTLTNDAYVSFKNANETSPLF